MLPEYGDIGDAVLFLEEAHKRGMRVIADLVMNHTSDQHPWFQESRQDATNPKADWYVWGDDDQRWSEARVIFVDTEPSNWTYDQQRGQYFWHRFFHHQPDLNFDNPEVADAMLDVVRFWLDLGLDGFRLDAVPYLFERDGTNGENLPETHEYLRRVRKVVDDEYPGRVLLAEANQWPEDVVDYFGPDGDECHMCFHFPLMPRMFMAVRREQRHPITEILAQTPGDPRRLPVGDLPAQPRRAHPRDGHRRRARLHVRRVRHATRACAATSASRGGCSRSSRTTRTWWSCSTPCSSRCRAARSSTTATRSAWATTSSSATATACAPRCSGRPTATPASPPPTSRSSTCPPLMDPVYGFQAVNVEAQQRDPSSFLHWLRRLLQVRREHPVFGTGTFEVLHADNPSVLAYLRSDDDHTVLCVNNLSRFPQPCELMLEQHAGKVPVELTGRVPFPPIGELPYFVTLAPHGFYWFSLQDGGQEDLP